MPANECVDEYFASEDVSELIGGAVEQCRENPDRLVCVRVISELIDLGIRRGYNCGMSDMTIRLREDLDKLSRGSI